VMEQFKSLDTLDVGCKAIIRKITAQGILRRKLLDMGAIPKSEIEVAKIAPFGDPIDIKIKGYHLSLRKQEARGILVEMLT